MISQQDIHELTCVMASFDAGNADVRNVDARYVVNKVIKETPVSRTELVHATNNPQKLFVRKSFVVSAGGEAVYKLINAAQKRGGLLKHCPRIRQLSVLGSHVTVVRDYLEGPTLEEVVSKEGPSINLALKVMPSLCQAVCELHDLPGGPVIHRDIKPSNIIVAHRSVFLIDLGIARVYRKNAITDTQHLGTPGFAPPEQFGFAQTDITSDVYALGVVLYYCLTGELLQNGNSRGASAQKGIPHKAQAIIEKACAFDPKQRYQSAAELLRAFRCAFKREEKHFAKIHPETAFQYDGFQHDGAGWFAKFNLSVRCTCAAQKATKHKAVRIGLYAWDVFLALLWGICWYSGIANLVNPQPVQANEPLALLIVEYGYMLIMGSAFVLFPFLYKPRMCQKISAFRHCSWLKQWGICWLIALSILVSSVVIVNAFFPVVQ